MLFLPRPISPFVLYDKLNEIGEMMQRESLKSGFVEFVNSKHPEEFSRKHILVVDDDPQQLIHIRDQLREFYEVTVINSGRQVIKCLNKFKTDLIFLDYLMPEQNGPDVLEEIRKHPQFRDIPVVFLTGVSEREVVTKIIVELKPQGYLLKPTTKIEIVSKVIEILG
ncbi:MAG: response regulator [Ruminiclostridium sp.]|nr:response regulator [Ruminiclostridium sp.]